MAFRDIPGILSFDKKTILRVAKDKRQTLWAHLIPALAVVVSYLVVITFNLFRMPDFFGDPAALVILALFVFIIAPAVLIGATWAFAGLYRVFAMLFSGSGSARGLFRARGHGAAVHALGFIPIPYWALVLLFYQLALDVKIVKEVEELDTWRSLIVVVLATLCIVFVLFATLLVYNLWFAMW